MLHRIFEDIKAAPIGLSENIEAAPTDMIRVAKEFGSRASSLSARIHSYESGKRTGSWVKYKVTQWALTKEEMKNCVWLKPELVAQIEFTEWTPDGHLRHSRFVGLRDDKKARDVGRAG